MDIPTFEPDETEAAFARDRDKAKRARRRDIRRIDRYWLMSFLNRLLYGDGFESYNDDIQENWLRPLKNRAFFRSMRAWQSIHLHAKRNAHKASRMRIRTALRRKPNETPVIDEGTVDG